MALSSHHRLVWSGLGKEAWDHVGSRAALQHELQTPPVQRNLLRGTRERSLARHTSCSARAVGQTRLLVCGCHMSPAPQERLPHAWL